MLSGKVFCALLAAFPLLIQAAPAAEGPRPGRPPGPDSAAQSFSQPPETIRFTLKEAIAFALAHNPAVLQSEKNIGIEEYAKQSANADRLPRIDFSTGLTEYRYPTPVSPISGIPTPGSNVTFPEFSRTINDYGLTFRLPLYRGGRLDRAVRIAELRKGAAEDSFSQSRQELVFNVTSVFHKTAQLEELRKAGETSVKQLQAHKKDVDQLLQAGTAAKIDLLKTEVELAHAEQDLLAVTANRDNSIELFRSILGLDDIGAGIAIVPETTPAQEIPPYEENVALAFSRRPEIKAVSKQLEIGRERVKMAQGKRLPEISVSAGYTETGGERLDYKDNWNAGVRLSIPVFEGGSISAEVGREKLELEKTRQQERALRLTIAREVKEATLTLRTTVEQVAVTEKAIASAEENLRIESLKYRTGAGKTTDVIDAQTALYRARTDYCQAVYDREIAIAALKKAVAENEYGEGASK